MIRLCISLRPGTLLGYQGKVWKVTANDTLLQVFTAWTIDVQPPERKNFRYRAGQEIQVRWTPDSRH